MKQSTGLGLFTAFFVVFLPFVTASGLFYGSVNAKFFYIIGVLLLIFLFVSYSLWFSKKTLTLRHNIFSILIFATLGIYYLSAFFGINAGKSLWSDIARSSGVFFLTHIALLAVLLGNWLKERDWSIVRRSLVISGAVFSVLTMLGSADGLGMVGRFLWVDLSISGLTFGNSTFAGAYLVLVFIFGLIEINKTARWSAIWKVLLGSLVLIAGSPILFSFKSVIGSARASGITLVSVVLFVLGYFVINKIVPLAKKKYFIWAWSGVWIVGLFTGVALLFTSGSFVQNKYIELSSSARIVVWDIGLNAVKEKPLLGWGPENFDRAFQANFDNRLYSNKTIVEVWFDRAHNIFIDILVDVGVVGALMIVFLIGYFLYILYRAKKLGQVGETEMMLLCVLVVAHVLQLQTSFDTVGTYVLMGLFLAYGVWLEKLVNSQSHKTENQQNIASSISPVVFYRICACLIIVGSLFSAKYLVLDEYVRQKALVKTFLAKKADDQMSLARTSLSRTSSFESLRLSSASFVKGALTQVADSGGELNNTKLLISYIDLYDGYYRTYLEKQPLDYRARMNYAYILLTETTFGKDRMEEAKSIIKDSYALSPANPITFLLDALANVYSGNLVMARQKIKEATALNNDVVIVQNFLKYIETQEKNFPNISVLKLENL